MQAPCSAQVTAIARPPMSTVLTGSADCTEPAFAMWTASTRPTTTSRVRRAQATKRATRMASASPTAGTGVLRASSTSAASKASAPTSRAVTPSTASTPSAAAVSPIISMRQGTVCSNAPICQMRAPRTATVLAGTALRDDAWKCRHASNLWIAGIRPTSTAPTTALDRSIALRRCASEPARRPNASTAPTLLPAAMSIRAMRCHATATMRVWDATTTSAMAAMPFISMRSASRSAKTRRQWTSPSATTRASTKTSSRK
mmetsp:Transcript_13928/g.39625  ORF Transcript_13928/g.39625 Transcript_13928/m.39625 type:complete len:259 (-) Transcript_13928:23-799(-)